MSDVLDAILNEIPSANLQLQVAKHLEALRHEQFPGGKPSARELVSAVESEVRERQNNAFHFDIGSNAILSFRDRSWTAGIFETPSIADLRGQIPMNSALGGRGKVRLFLLDGISPITDIGFLQAACGADTLFQVASQFNCLESVDSFVAPVASYFNDRTQGPRASISAFPATLLRHYAAPGENGVKFVQSTQGLQLNLLKDACNQHFVISGYLTGKDIMDPEEFLAQLERGFNNIRVGVHANVEVVFGHNWDGKVDPELAKPIAQVFTSTIAGGGYGGEEMPQHIFRGACQQLLRAAYLGTLLAATKLQKRRVVLTLIGGGVFKNRFEDIWGAITWATKEIEAMIDSDLDVIINGYDIGSKVDLDVAVRSDIMQRNGRIATFDDKGLVAIS